MNRERRKRIKEIIYQLEILKDELGEVAEDEQNYFDSIPENLLESANATASEQALEQIMSAGDALDECLTCLDIE